MEAGIKHQSTKLLKEKIINAHVLLGRHNELQNKLTDVQKLCDKYYKYLRRVTAEYQLEVAKNNKVCAALNVTQKELEESLSKVEQLELLIKTYQVERKEINHQSVNDLQKRFDKLLTKCFRFISESVKNDPLPKWIFHDVKADVQRLQLIHPLKKCADIVNLPSPAWSMPSSYGSAESGFEEGNTDSISNMQMKNGKIAEWVSQFISSGPVKGSSQSSLDKNNHSGSYENSIAIDSLVSSDSCFQPFARTELIDSRKYCLDEVESLKRSSLHDVTLKSSSNKNLTSTGKDAARHEEHVTLTDEKQRDINSMCDESEAPVSELQLDGPLHHKLGVSAIRKHKKKSKKKNRNRSKLLRKKSNVTYDLRKKRTFSIFEPIKFQKAVFDEESCASNKLSSNTLQSKQYYQEDSHEIESAPPKSSDGKLLDGMQASNSTPEKREMSSSVVENERIRPPVSETTSCDSAAVQQAVDIPITTNNLCTSIHKKASDKVAQNVSYALPDLTSHEGPKIEDKSKIRFKQSITSPTIQKFKKSTKSTTSNKTCQLDSPSLLEETINISKTDHSFKHGTEVKINENTNSFSDKVEKVHTQPKNGDAISILPIEEKRLPLELNANCAAVGKLIEDDCSITDSMVKAVFQEMCPSPKRRVSPIKNLVCRKLKAKVFNRGIPEKPREKVSPERRKQFPKPFQHINVTTEVATRISENNENCKFSPSTRKRLPNTLQHSDKTTEKVATQISENNEKRKFSPIKRKRFSNTFKHRNKTTEEVATQISENNENRIFSPIKRKRFSNTFKLRDKTTEEVATHIIKNNENLKCSPSRRKLFSHFPEPIDERSDGVNSNNTLTSDASSSAVHVTSPDDCSKSEQAESNNMIQKEDSITHYHEQNDLTHCATNREIIDIVESEPVLITAENGENMHANVENCRRNKQFYDSCKRQRLSRKRTLTQLARHTHRLSRQVHSLTRFLQKSGIKLKHSRKRVFKTLKNATKCAIRESDINPSLTPKSIVSTPPRGNDSFASNEVFTRTGTRETVAAHTKKYTTLIVNKLPRNEITVARILARHSYDKDKQKYDVSITPIPLKTNETNEEEPYSDLVPTCENRLENSQKVSNDICLKDNLREPDERDSDSLASVTSVELSINKDKVRSLFGDSPPPTLIADKLEAPSVERDKTTTIVDATHGVAHCKQKVNRRQKVPLPKKSHVEADCSRIVTRSLRSRILKNASHEEAKQIKNLIDDNPIMEESVSLEENTLHVNKLQAAVMSSKTDSDNASLTLVNNLESADDFRNDSPKYVSKNVEPKLLSANHKIKLNMGPETCDSSKFVDETNLRVEDKQSSEATILQSSGDTEISPKSGRRFSHLMCGFSPSTSFYNPKKRFSDIPLANDLPISSETQPEANDSNYVISYKAKNCDSGKYSKEDNMQALGDENELRSASPLLTNGVQTSSIYRYTANACEVIESKGNERNTEYLTDAFVAVESTKICDFSSGTHKRTFNRTIDNSLHRHISKEPGNVIRPGLFADTYNLRSKPIIEKSTLNKSSLQNEARDTALCWEKLKLMKMKKPAIDTCMTSPSVNFRPTRSNACQVPTTQITIENLPTSNSESDGNSIVFSGDNSQPLHDQEEQEAQGTNSVESCDDTFLGNILREMEKQKAEYQGPKRSATSAFTKLPPTKKKNKSTKNFDVKSKKKVKPATILKGPAEKALKSFVKKGYKTQEDASRALKICINTLSPVNDMTLVRAIVHVVLENVEEELDLRFTPPAPPLTPTQHRLFALFSATPRFKELHNSILHEIYDKIFPETFFWPDDSLESCVRFYTALCRQTGEKTAVGKLLLNAVVKMKQRGSVVISAILAIWPEIMPFASETPKYGLHATLAFLILQTAAPKLMRQKITLNAVKNQLKLYYGFTDNQETMDNFARGMISAMRQDKSVSVEALVAISSRNSWSWTYSTVVTPLLEFLGVWQHGGVSDEIAKRYLVVLARTLAQFPSNVEKAVAAVKVAVSRLGEILLSKEVSHMGDENIVNAILRTNTIAPVKEILSAWIPQEAVTPTLHEDIKRIMTLKKVKQGFVTKNIKKTSVKANKKRNRNRRRNCIRNQKYVNDQCDS